MSKRDYPDLPPQANEAQDAERGCLGGMLRWPAVIADVSLAVAADDFRSEGHRALFQTILALFSSGKPADRITVADSMLRAGSLALLGSESKSPAAYLADLVGISGSHPTQYAELVRDYAILRRLDGAGAEAIRLSANPHGPAPEMVALAEEAIFAVSKGLLRSDIVTLEQAMGEVFDQIDARSGERKKTVSYGIADLDDFTAGLHAGEMVILAARPGVGKTAVALAIARTVADEIGPVLFASLEMPRAELAQRLLSAESGVSGYALRHGNLTTANIQALLDAKDRLASLPLRIDDYLPQGLARISSQARRESSKANLALLVVDYLQLVDPENRRDNREMQVATNSRGLKALAKQLKVPVIALAQVGRKSEEKADKTPELWHLRESGAIEADADLVILLHEEEKGKGPLKFIIAKNRHGETGDFEVPFERARMRIGERNVWRDAA